MGLPVIATDFSGIAQFVRTEHSYPIKVERLIDADSDDPRVAGAKCVALFPCFVSSSSDGQPSFARSLADGRKRLLASSVT